MENWLIYAILASLSWGSYIIITKLAKGIDPFLSGLAMAIGIFVFFGALYIIKTPSFDGNWNPIFLSVIAGAVWALGMLFIILALKSGADVSKLAPIYNTNTLVAVMLGIVILHEIPALAEQFKVIVGAILIILGGILISI